MERLTQERPVIGEYLLSDPTLPLPLPPHPVSFSHGSPSTTCTGIVRPLISRHDLSPFVLPTQNSRDGTSRIYIKKEKRRR